jgi:hypothetical protein
MRFFLITERFWHNSALDSTTSPHYANAPQKSRRSIYVQIRKRGYPTQTRSFKKEDAQRWATIIDSEAERGVFV